MFVLNIRFLHVFIALSLSLSASAADLAGKVVFVRGKPTAVDTTNSVRELTRGSEIFAGDRLISGPGKIQVSMKDGAFISIQPESELTIEDYAYSGKADGTEKVTMALVKGGFRAVTGVIGHGNPEAYKLKTSVATIGIRGTGYSTRICDGNCPGKDDGLYHSTWEGITYVSNNTGTVDVGTSQSIKVESISSPVEVLSQASDATAADTITETLADAVESDSSQSHDTDTVISSGEETNSEGASVAIVGDNKTIEAASVTVASIKDASIVSYTRTEKAIATVTLADNQAIGDVVTYKFEAKTEGAVELTDKNLVGCGDKAQLKCSIIDNTIIFEPVTSITTNTTITTMNTPVTPKMPQTPVVSFVKGLSAIHIQSEFNQTLGIYNSGSGLLHEAELFFYNNVPIGILFSETYQTNGVYIKQRGIATINLNNMLLNKDITAYPEIKSFSQAITSGAITANPPTVVVNYEDNNTAAFQDFYLNSDNVGFFRWTTGNVLLMSADSAKFLDQRLPFQSLHMMFGPSYTAAHPTSGTAVYNSIAGTSSTSASGTSIADASIYNDIGINGATTGTQIYSGVIKVDFASSQAAINLQVVHGVTYTINGWLYLHDEVGVALTIDGYGLASRSKPVTDSLCNQGCSATFIGGFPGVVENGVPNYLGIGYVIDDTDPITGVVLFKR